MSDKILNEQINQIIYLNRKIENFWSNSVGWTPASVNEILSISRLDWQVSLSESLRRWVNIKNITDGDLILAWANLGALTEGTLKLFLCIYYEDYKNDINKIIRRDNSLVDPQNLMFELLKQFFEKLGILSKDSLFFVKNIQQKRNAIHAYNNRNIGDHNEFLNSVGYYLEFLFEVESCFPYP